MVTASVAPELFDAVDAIPHLTVPPAQSGVRGDGSRGGVDLQARSIAAYAPKVKIALDALVSTELKEGVEVNGDIAARRDGERRGP